MSLEDLIKENTEALKENSALLKQVIGMAPASGGSTGAAQTTSTSSDDSGDDEEAALRAEYEELFGKKAGRKKIETIKSEIEAAKAKSSDDGSDGDDGDGADYIDFSDLKSNLAKWLGEFSKKEDKENPEGIHPEVIARREALKKILTSEKVLNDGAGKLNDLDGDDKGPLRNIVNTWLEEKAKKIDRGFGIGRLVADPAPQEDDDELGI